MLLPCAAFGSPYPKNTSCSHSGTTVSAFIRSRIHSKIDLKLFSLGRRRIKTFNEEYIASSPRSTSSWYCAASSCNTNVRSYPAGPEEPSVPSPPTLPKSLYRVPSPSRTSTTSPPRTRRNPNRSATVFSFVFSFPFEEESPASPPSACSKNTTSCCLSSSHSTLAGPFREPRFTRTSHRTDDGFVSPINGALTWVTVSAPAATGSAMRDHPLN
mmetsp:Transcript_13930/g.46129  ORF Transcript_13930/g.46129 Transcript_13930/m.46129 type:complete len:214 (-) Transcript_13930:2286-2927(-)